MKENKVKITLFPNQKGIDYRYVLESLFKLSSRNEGKNFEAVAEKILRKAAQRGDKGLFAADWKKYHKELDVTQSQYFFILRTLRNAGLLYRSKGKIYVSRRFAEHLTEVATAMNTLMMNLGVGKEE